MNIITISSKATADVQWHHAHDPETGTWDVWPTVFGHRTGHGWDAVIDSQGDLVDVVAPLTRRIAGYWGAA